MAPPRWTVSDTPGPPVVNDFFKSFSHHALGQLRAWLEIGTEGITTLSSAQSDVGTLDVIIVSSAGAIGTGVKADVVIDFDCTVVSATLLADQVGSIVVNVWKDTYANFPPTVADKITASAPPTISAAVNSQDTTLTGWTTSIVAGDVLRFNVDSCSSIARVTVALKLRRV